MPRPVADCPEGLHGGAPAAPFLFPALVSVARAVVQGCMNETFAITTDYIKLDSLLKGVNAVGSGGEAKLVVASGLVEVNNEVELRRGRKLYPGDRVRLAGHEYQVGRATAGLK